MHEIANQSSPRLLPALIGSADGRTRTRFAEFFAANIRNVHTRRACLRAVGEFMDWCQDAGVTAITAVQPLHVAAWIETKMREVSPPTVKQQLAAIRHLFDWLVTGQVMPVNPAASVRGPRHVVKRGKTPVLEAAEARALLDGIDSSTLVGLRDRAMIALMVYSFPRVGAAVGMRVQDVYTQNRRLWVRLADWEPSRESSPPRIRDESPRASYGRVGDTRLLARRSFSLVCLSAHVRRP